MASKLFVARSWEQKIPFPVLTFDGYKRVRTLLVCRALSRFSVSDGLSFCLGREKGSLLLKNNNCTVFMLDFPICQITYSELSKLKKLKSLLLEPRRGSTGNEAVEEAAESLRGLWTLALGRKLNYCNIVISRNVFNSPNFYASRIIVYWSL